MATKEDVFLSDEEWDRIRISGNYDYVVVGSSFCATGFTRQTLKRNPDAKILMIERGDYESAEFFLHLSPRELRERAVNTEEFPWTPGEGNTHKVRGVNYNFGGRSPFWKAWCPKPTDDEMKGWPSETIEKVKEYFPEAKKLLSVQPVDEIGSNSTKPFQGLQTILLDKLTQAGEVAQHAPLALTQKTSHYGHYQKFSVFECLLNILKQHRTNVRARLNCEVRRIRRERNRATVLETSRGDVELGRAKLILAMSTIPSTTLILNSFPHLRGIGDRFTAHLASYVHARVPCEKWFDSIQRQATDRLEMAAIYVNGKDKQFHMQLNAVAAVGDNNDRDYDVMRNLLKTPKFEMLKTSEDHVVFVCATLGQVNHKNPRNKLCLKMDENDLTRNVTLHVALDENDRKLWDKMDEATFRLLHPLAPVGESIEYWHKNPGDENANTGEWRRERPDAQLVRSEDLVHPASTMWIGASDSAPVDLDYRIRGVDNVYLTGGALWPTSSSWNPTCTMTAMAMDLADKLHRQQLTLKSKL